MGKSKYIGAATARKSAIDDSYDEREVAAIAARCILATHTATLDALRRAYFEEHPDEDRKALRLHLRFDEALSIHWDFRPPAGRWRDGTPSGEHPTDDEGFVLGPDEEDERYSEELLREFAEEYELMTILEIEWDLAQFRSYYFRVS